MEFDSSFFKGCGQSSLKRFETLTKHREKTPHACSSHMKPGAHFTLTLDHPITFSKPPTQTLKALPKNETYQHILPKDRFSPIENPPLFQVLEPAITSAKTIKKDLRQVRIGIPSYQKLVKLGKIVQKLEEVEKEIKDLL